MLLKIALFGVMRVYVVRGSKSTLFTHTVHYCCSSMLHLSKMRRFFKRSSFWEERCALIGQLSSALWLAEYLKRETEIWRSLPYCDAVSRRNESKTIKSIINEASVAFSEDITDYNDSYTMSAFVIIETPNKDYSTLL